MQKITPFIWFEKGAKEAANFYVKVFGKRSKIKDVSTITDTPSGTVEVVTLELAGQEFTLMAAGPFRKINEAISFVVHCETQKEVDHFWNGLSKDGEKGQCGWLKDKYGVSWQVVPTVLAKLMSDSDPIKAGRVAQAMLTMTKLDIAKLKDAYKGNSYRAEKLKSGEMHTGVGYSPQLAAGFASEYDNYHSLRIEDSLQMPIRTLWAAGYFNADL